MRTVRKRNDLPVAPDLRPLAGVGAWVVLERGRSWRFVSHTGKILGFVRRATFGAWDGYICTGKKWPDSDKLVTRPRPYMSLSNPFHDARNAVEEALIVEMEKNNERPAD